MAVKHAVRSTLATLLVGVFGQRLLQLLSFLCIGRALGAERLGQYAQGLAAAALLGVLAGAGVRNLLARAVARSPLAAGDLVIRAVCTRLALGTVLAGGAIAVCFQVTDSPWFWTMCLLHVLPGAFDLKNLLDAAGRTRVEVLLETGATLLYLVLVAAWLYCGGEDLVVLTGISLASRTAYALLALPATARLPRGAQVPRPTPPAPAARAAARSSAAVAQTLHEVMSCGDVWFVALCFGDGAAGLYATAVRFAGAALLPSTQLARLLLPHLLHAAARGDAGRTLGTASRVTLLVTLPMLAGGAATAEGLCALPGPEFTGAAPALVLALLAGCLQHSGWQRSHALLAVGNDRAYARSLAWPALLQMALLALGGWSFAHATAGTVGTDPLGAAGDAAAAALGASIGAIAHGLYLVSGMHAVRQLAREPRRWQLASPLFTAALTYVAAALPGRCLDGPAALPVQLVAGGFAFALGIWLVELRGRLDRIGDGLAEASGFRA